MTSAKPGRVMAMAEPEQAQREVHAGLQRFLDDGEIAVCWVLTIDVAGPDGKRYLAHRAGGGVDGTDNPMAWTALGMLTASADLARQQLADSSWPADDEEDDEP